MSTPVSDEETNKTETSALGQWLDRAIIFCLIAFAFFASISIAATQTAYLLGMLLWLIRFLFKPHPRLRSCHKPLEILLFVFFLLTTISSFFSYEPKISINKLRGVALFLIVYFISQNARSSRKVFRGIVVALIAGVMLTVGYTAVDYALGRGVKVYGMVQDGPLYRAKCLEVGRPEIAHLIFDGVRDGNTIVEANGRKVKNLSDVFSAIEANEKQATGPAKIKVYRKEIFYNCEVERGALLSGNAASEKLGVTDWSRGRDHRAAGFYGHYTTYGEALQLITSLAFGLFIALGNKRSLNGFVLMLVLAGLCFALLLTATRGSQLGFLGSAFLIVLMGANRKVLLVTIICALPLALAGLFVLQQKRKVGFFDRSDSSVSWRETVWRESFQVYTSKPRHLIVGVGMDSLKKRWREWGMFDGGKIPIGHLHSTPLQIAFERGLPALIVWLLILGVYARMLFPLARSNLTDDFMKRGFALGALGGLVGFFVSGFFHYNLGDSEVAMIFYLIIGISLLIKHEQEERLLPAD
jgi:hypothetical protein